MGKPLDPENPCKLPLVRPAERTCAVAAAVAVLLLRVDEGLAVALCSSAMEPWLLCIVQLSNGALAVGLCAIQQWSPGCCFLLPCFGPPPHEVTGRSSGLLWIAPLDHGVAGIHLAGPWGSARDSGLGVMEPSQRSVFGFKVHGGQLEIRV